MASKKKRAKKMTKNEKNAKVNVKVRIESIVQSKFERERTSILPPIALSRKVKSFLLMKAMENGFLDDVKIFHLKITNS